MASTVVVSANQRAGGKPPPLQPEEILAAFDGDIQPIRTTMMYRLGILVVWVVMVLLPSGSVLASVKPHATPTVQAGAVKAETGSWLSGGGVPPSLPPQDAAAKATSKTAGARCDRIARDVPRPLGHLTVNEGGDGGCRPRGSRVPDACHPPIVK